MPSGPTANARVRIALLFLFFTIVFSVGAWFADDLSRLQDRLSARESQAALQGVSEPAQLDEALRQHPANKFLQMMAMAIKAVTSRLLPARADYYRAYENYVAVLVREFGAYKVVNGEFIFPFQHVVDRYNVAAEAMTVAAKRVNDLEAERRSLLKSQQDGLVQLVNGK